ncbi:glutathione S-transferase family protein [Aestuariibacter sp. AA17]|uniref:Glutathione S-transferase family protein n=1 Tax=Fluctibacter corallii TaxID=2984329 RepID=A0ABT3ACH8_9ALTE|nr:glutathione S-transferase family protein [Aestuariibacter sp. AA17]MCV2885976.1 glutathione S-transferase family protein [Aestuariibacter sp. AA17]
MKMFGAPISPYCRKVQLVMAHKAIPFEWEFVTPGPDNHSYTEISPMGKIPAIQTEDGFTLADSSVIIAYLEKRFPNHSLYPTNPEDYAKALFFEEFADTALSEACTGLYFQKRIGPLAFGLPTNEDKVSEIMARSLPNALAILERLLPENGWIVNNQYSVADVAVGAMLISLPHMDIEIDNGTYPKTSQFLNTFMQREEVKTQIETENYAFATFQKQRMQTA